MKSFIALAAANSVPIESRVPGWQQGTHGGAVELRVFYDLLCPDSLKTYNDLKALMNQTSANGPSYKELLDIKVTPFVLPYHLHSYEIQ